MTDVFSDGEEAVDVGGLEEGVGAVGAEVGEGGLVEAAGFDDSVLIEVVDDEVHELDLVGGEAGAVEELGEGILGGSAVEANEGTAAT